MPDVEELIPWSSSVSYTEYFSSISNWRDSLKAQYNSSFFYSSILKFLKELDGTKEMALGKRQKESYVLRLFSLGKES